MKNLPVLALVLAALALCGVCIAQWRREAEFRHRLDAAATQLRTETAARHEAVEKTTTLEREIERLTQLRADTEAKLIEVTDALATARQRMEEKNEAVADRNLAVEAHNAAIAEANSRLQQVTAERDRAIEQLNERTRAYNELMTKRASPR